MGLSLAPTPSPSEAAGQPYEQVLEKLQGAGFTDVSCGEFCDLGEENISDDGKVSGVIVAGNTSFKSDSKYLGSASSSKAIATRPSLSSAAHSAQ